MKVTEKNSMRPLFRKENVIPLLSALDFEGRLNALRTYYFTKVRSLIVKINKMTNIFSKWQIYYITPNIPPFIRIILAKLKIMVKARLLFKLGIFSLLFVSLRG